VHFLRRHALFAGTTGSGKSGGLNVLMANLTACQDVIIWGIDLKKGMELGPWQECLDRLATTPEQAAILLRDAVAILQARAAYLAAHGRRTWEPSPEMPALIIIIDEYAELAEQAPEAMDDTDSIARLGRALAVTLVAATQRPTQKAMGKVPSGRKWTCGYASASVSRETWTWSSDRECSRRDGTRTSSTRPANS
jgi:S-DNA-T family DNA segregation ATPase FtsK/SpoIIIE